MALDRRRTIETFGDVAIDVTREGGGPVIVLLPSKARDSLDFDAAAEGLAERGFRVIRPQPRGALGSRGPLTGLKLHNLARDVAEVIRAEGGEPAIVVGHAFGNWVARTLAVMHPELVRGIVLAAAAARSVPAEITATVAAAANTGLDREKRLAALRLGFFAPGNDPSVARRLARRRQPLPDGRDRGDTAH
ncbi:MAG TPA: alpha/beta fold hydrolase [Hyphomicrobiaceae bacterium]|nr:alpha/beta fold hydrolase [Hyphomicrobiaceae bacterium]